MPTEKWAPELFKISNLNVNLAKLTKTERETPPRHSQNFYTTDCAVLKFVKKPVPEILHCVLADDGIQRVICLKISEGKRII